MNINIYNTETMKKKSQRNERDWKMMGQRGGDDEMKGKSLPEENFNERVERDSYFSHATHTHTYT